MMLEDHRRYAEVVAEQTGLDPAVVAAWVQAAAGPGVRRIGHGYLTPGYAFPSVELAANAAAEMIHRTGLPARLTVAGPLAQAVALGDDPRLPGHGDAILELWAKAAP